MEREIKLPGWLDGPPKSDIEGWNYERLNKLTNIATSIATALLAGTGKGDNTLGHNETELKLIARDSVVVAKEILDRCEALQPRL